MKLKTLKGLWYKCAWDGKPIDIHLGLVMSLIHAWKVILVLCGNLLWKGLWNLKETISVLSSWDHIYKSNQNFKQDLESIIRKPKLIKGLDTLEVFLWCDEPWYDSSMLIICMWDVEL